MDPTPGCPEGGRSSMFRVRRHRWQWKDEAVLPRTIRTSASAAKPDAPRHRPIRAPAASRGAATDAALQVGAVPMPALLERVDEGALRRPCGSPAAAAAALAERSARRWRSRGRDRRAGHRQDAARGAIRGRRACRRRRGPLRPRRRGERLALSGVRGGAAALRRAPARRRLPRSHSARGDARTGDARPRACAAGCARASGSLGRAATETATNSSRVSSGCCCTPRAQRACCSSSRTSTGPTHRRCCCCVMCCAASEGSRLLVVATLDDRHPGAGHALDDLRRGCRAGQRPARRAAAGRSRGTDRRA